MEKDGERRSVKRKRSKNIIPDIVVTSSSSEMGREVREKCGI